MFKTKRLDTAFAWITFILMTAALYAIFIYAPNERIMGPVQKIFYFHVATAWVGFFAFFVVFVCGIVYLRTRNKLADITARCSAEIGLIFTSIVLVTGPIWGRSAWGAWWTWDSRLTTTLILWFLYLAYVLIRASGDSEGQKARFSAVFGVIAFLDIPIVFFSIRWWRTIHPVLIDAQGFNMDPRMLPAFFLSIVAFTFYYAYYLNKSIKIVRLEEDFKEIKQALREDN